MKPATDSGITIIVGIAALMIFGFVFLVPPTGVPIHCPTVAKPAASRPTFSQAAGPPFADDEISCSPNEGGPVVFIYGNNLTRADARCWLNRGALESDLKGPKMGYFSVLEDLAVADSPQLFRLLPTIKDAEVRQFIVTHLQTKADGDTIQNIVDRFDKSPNPEEKRLMLEILGGMTSPGSAPLLANGVRDDGVSSSDPVVRACVKALASVADEDGLTAVLERASRESDASVKHHLFSGIMNAGNSAVKSFLLCTAQAASNPTASVRQSAIYALRAYGDPETVGILRGVSQCTEPMIAAAAEDSLRAIDMFR